MNDWEKLIRSYFSFSSKEKRGMLVLTGILFLLLFVRVYQRYSTSEFSEIQIQELEKAELLFQTESKETKTSNTKPKAKASYHSFDPNTADSIQLIAAGFSAKQASALLRYRTAGAYFNKKEDLKKLFWMKDYLYDRLTVRIQEKKEDKKKIETPIPQKIQYYDANTVDSTELISIRGIGSYTAMNYLKYRNWLGGYVDSSQFREIRGLRKEQVELLKTRLVLSTVNPKRIRINSISIKELERHPYIRYKARVIINYRQQHGNFMHIEDLLKTGVLNERILEKLKPYLDFNP